MSWKHDTKIKTARTRQGESVLVQKPLICFVYAFFLQLQCMLIQFVSEVLSFVFFVFCAGFQSVSEFRSFGVSVCYIRFANFLFMLSSCFRIPVVSFCFCLFMRAINQLQNFSCSCVQPVSEFLSFCLFVVMVSTCFRIAVVFCVLSVAAQTSFCFRYARVVLFVNPTVGLHPETIMY